MNKRACSVDEHALLSSKEEAGRSRPTRFFVRFGEIDTARVLVERYHYSRRFAANVQVCATFHEEGGLFGTCGNAVAACVVSIPPTRWSEPVYELSRLVKADGATCSLSQLIALTMRECRRRNMELIVSFADWTQRHHGGVYQACSWNFGGTREPRMDGVVIEGRFVPGRTANSVYGTRSVRALAARGVVAEPHFDNGKHLYWVALTNNGKRMAQSLGLKSFPYPKPTAGVAAIGL